MKLERSNVDFPLWRKKVDKSLFEHSGTTIPIWACEMWKLASLYSDVSSRRDPKAKTKIRFEKNYYEGWVTTAKHGRSSPAYRLWFDDSLSLELKHTYVMSYIRSLETSLSAEKIADVENSIPFWEFLDIEFNHKENVFVFVSYYKQQPSFPNLFSRLITSPAISRIDDELSGKSVKRIHKQDWKPRNELEFEIGAHNVIYTLVDTDNKLLYVGEAIDLVKRLSQNYPSIPNWNYFRYDVLPDVLADYRNTLERMMIRSYATIFENKKGVSSLSLSDYRLANEKIDK